MKYVALVLGGFLGGMLRYLMGLLQPSQGSFPYDILLVNLLGSFSLGLFYSLSDFTSIPSWLRVGLGTGAIGAFTTFSTFCVGAEKLASIHFLSANLYVLLSVLGGPILAFTGNRFVVVLARRTVHASEEFSA